MQRAENVMGTKKVMPLLISMSIPPTISMLIQALYNIVDSMFVARISTDALTAVSLAYPLQNLALAVAVGFGVGLNACIAKKLGEKDEKGVNNVATHGFIMTGVHTILFILIGIFFTKPFLGMFTDDPEIFKMSCEYAYIVICCSFGMMFHLFMEKVFQATGDMVIPMLMQGVGAIVNIIMDPILIFGYFGFPEMGVPGAAVATVLAQITSCVLSFILYFVRNNGVHIQFRGFRLQKRMLGQIYGIAIPSGLMMSLPSVLVGALNAILADISDIAVAVFGLYFKLQSFVYMPANGVVQGMRPIISYNYGARKYDRMNKTIKSAMLTVGIIMAVGTLLFFLFPGLIMQLFQADENMMQTGITMLRVISLGFLVSTVGIVLAGTFEALGKGLPSLIISLLRQLLIIPVLSFVLAKPFGLVGVWATFPIAELCAAVAAFLLYRGSLKKI